MFKRVTIWAQNFEIAHLVVKPISVLVMNAKDLRDGIIAASFASGKKSAPDHCLADSRESGGPFILTGLIDAGSAAKLSALGRGVSEGFAAMLAGVFNGAQGPLRPMVALAGAVFRDIAPRGNMGELRPADPAIFSDLFSGGKRATTARAVFERFPSVFSNLNPFSAMLAMQRFRGGF